MRLLIVSDAWFPQVNGVVRTLSTVRGLLEEDGHDVPVLTPDQFKTIPCPSYPEIRLAITTPWAVSKRIAAVDPDCIHIATEGPLGMMARRYCVKRGLPFSTSFHTKFPEYIHARWRVPVRWGYAVLRWFHGAAKSVMVATPTLEKTLTARGFTNLRRWSRGVDTALFKPRDKAFLSDPRPISLFVGRVAVEKNLEAFLKLDLPGTKNVVGDGPQIEELRKRYPDARFVGAKQGEELGQHFAAADVFVFPSLTDTFGLVLLEAMASGLPVAAFPVTGPVDVITDPAVGALDDDLRAAFEKALTLDPQACRQFALGYSWDASKQQFFSNLHPFDGPAAPAGAGPAGALATEQP